MGDLHARLRVAGLDDDEARQLPVVIDGRSLAQMELSTWRGDAGDFDVLIGIPDRTGRVIPYEELIARAEELQLHGVVVHAAALDDIIASKEWANRPKDQSALPELRALHNSTDDQ
jgi:predicted nucleotidyltransferase